MFWRAVPRPPSTRPPGRESVEKVPRLVVTVTGPVVAPRPTWAYIFVSEPTQNWAAGTLPIVTAVTAPLLASGLAESLTKPVPWMATYVPEQYGSSMAVPTAWLLMVVAPF